MLTKGEVCTDKARTTARNANTTWRPCQNFLHFSAADFRSSAIHLSYSGVPSVTLRPLPKVIVALYPRLTLERAEASILSTNSIGGQRPGAMGSCQGSL